MADLRLEDVRVRHRGADVDALAGLDLTVDDGRRLVVLGGSGSGKTTVLRAVAGLVPLASGRVLIDGRDVTGLPPGERDVALVHQEAALQPHIDVRSNLGFSLRMRRVARDEEDRRVTAEARAFGLVDLLGRRPPVLATGQRHEVALARSLVRRCAVLLMDEPLARVDPRRRSELRQELIAVQEGYGLTTLLTTNDPVTAHALAEQVAVLEDGHLLQTGTPLQLTATPASTTVAELLVVPPINLLAGAVEPHGRQRRVVAGPLRVTADRPLPPGPVTVGVRPDHLELGGTGPPVPVRRRVVLGAQTELTVGRDDEPELRILGDRALPAVGARVRVRARRGHVHVFDRASGAAIAHGL